MKAKLKKINKVNLDHAKEVIKHQTERCVEIIRTALEVAEICTGDNRIWFGDFSNPPLAKMGYIIDDIYVNCGMLWVSLRGEYDNGMMPVANMDIHYLIELTEFIRDNMDELLEQWEFENEQ